MTDYTKFLKWAIVSMVDRHTQDDHKSKIHIAGLFENPIVAKDSFMSNLPNEDFKRYLLHIDELERFEEFYNHIQDINEKYGDYAIYHIDDNNEWKVDELNRYRQILGI